MDESTRFLILSLDGGLFAIPIVRLIEIALSREIRKNGGETDGFEGMFDFRGRSIPVLNVKKNLKLQSKPGNTLLIVNSMRGVLGILVDAVTEIIDADRKPESMPPGVLDPAISCYRGILRHKGELMLLLNEDGLLQ